MIKEWTAHVSDKCIRIYQLSLCILWWSTERDHLSADTSAQGLNRLTIKVWVRHAFQHIKTSTVYCDIKVVLYSEEFFSLLFQEKGCSPILSSAQFLVLQRENKDIKQYTSPWKDGNITSALSPVTEHSLTTCQEHKRHIQHIYTDGVGAHAYTLKPIS